MKMTAATRTVQEWPVPEDLMASPAVENRNLFSRKYSVYEDPDEIMRVWLKMDKAAIESEFRTVFRILEPYRFAGRGVEIGAGLGVFAAMVARDYPEVEHIDAVELVPDVVRLLQTRTVPHVGGAEAAERVSSVIGSFDDIRLDDASTDFCIEIGSLHHSDDMARTLGEIARVLKPGGRLVMVDRVQPDWMPEAQKEFMLELQYSDAWKRDNGYPPEPLNRRQNGEHEIRRREWYAMLDAAGFVVERQLELRKPSLRRLWYVTRLLLPYGVRRHLGILPSRVSTSLGEALWTLGACLGIAGHRGAFRVAEREHTLLIARRRGEG